MGIEVFDDVPMSNINIAGTNKNEEATQKTAAQKAVDVFAYSPVALALGAVETVGETFGILDDDELADQLASELEGGASWAQDNYFGDATQHYTEHHEGYKLVAETAIMFTAVGAATKFVQTGGYLSKAFSKLGSAGEYLAPRLLSTGLTRQERMKRLAKAEELFVQQKNLQLSGSEYHASIKAEQYGMAADLFKESVAGELALYAVLSDSDVFFPEEQTFGEYLMWAAVPALVVSGIGYKAMGHYANSYVTRNVTPKVAEALNNKGLSVTDLITVPEYRGVGLAASSSYIADQKQAFDIARDSRERSNLNALIVQETAHSDSYVIDMANDEIFGHGIDKSYRWNTQADKAYVKTVTDYTQGEPTAAISMVSIIPATAETVASVPASVAKRIDNLEKELTEGFVELQAMESGTPEANAMFDLLQAKNAEKEKIDWLTTVVLEPDQTVIPIAEKRWTLLDDIADTSKVKTVTSQGFTRLADEHTVELGANIAMLEEGKLYFDSTIAGAKRQRDFVTILPEHKIADEQKNVASRALEDMTHLYDLDLGIHGQRVKSQLPADVVAEMHNWKGSADASKFRNWLEEQPERLADIRQTFDNNGFRERLMEFADDDGFLVLYRGEAQKHLEESPFNLVSMTPRPQTAADFGKESSGKQVIKRIVHIDDIVMPINAKGAFSLHEFEFIVKDTSKRILEHEMNHGQRIGAWVVTQRALDNYNPDTARTIRMARGRDSFELDYAVKVLEKFPEADVRYIGATGEITGIEALREMQFESLRQKAFSFQEWYAASKLDEAGKLPQGIKLKESQRLPQTEILRAHNLPLGDGFGDAPIVSILKEIMPAGNEAASDLRVIFKNMDGLEDAVRKRIMPNYLDEPNLEAKALRMDGSALKAEVPKDAKPVIIHHNSPLEDRVTAGSLNDLIADQKQSAMSSLSKADQTGGTIVKAVHDAWNGDTTIRHIVGQVDNLTDGVQRGAGIMTTHNFVGRSAPQLQLADQMGEVAKKAGDKIVSDLWKDKSEVFTKILSSKHNEASNAVTMAAHEISHGWDVLAEPVALGGGRFGLALDPASARNETLAKNLFDSSMKEMMVDDVVLLPVRSNPETHVVLDELSMQGLQGLTDLSHSYLDNVNAIRKAYGLPGINKREWHLPYFNMEEREVLWMMDDANKVAYPVTGSTAQQVQELAEEEVKAAAKAGKLMHYQSDDALRAHVENIGSQFEQMADMSKAGLQTGGKSLRGSPLTAEVGPDALKGIIHRLQGNFDDVIRYSSAASMRSELDYASRMRNSLNVGADKTVRARETVYDHFQRSVLQTPSLTDKTARGSLAKGIEKAADAGMSFVYDKYRGLVPAARQVSEGEFDAIQKLYGKQNSPYSDIADMILKTQKISAPPKSRKFVSAMNKFAGDYVLRVLDFGMPVLNAASLVAVQPAVYKAMQRGKTEDLVTWKQRVGAWTSQVDESFALPNTGKMAATGIHHMFSPEGREALQLYRDMGLLRHDVYERIETITAPIKGYSARMYDKGIKTLSFATDKSEELARAGSFMMNHAIATKMLGMKGKAAVHFAHKHTNANVGDYRPNNKPQIFQGVAGMPFGLFTTWVWNFGQRVFGDLEGGRLGAAGMQLMMQQVMFGAESHPMSALVLDHVTTNYDGSENIVDRLERAIGSDATNVIMNGTIAQMTGVALQGRSSVTAPALFRGELSKDLVPALGVADTIVQGVTATIKASQADGLTKEKMLEILGTYKVNGAITNIANHIQGYSVDRAGNMVNADVNNIVDSIAHSVELKSLREHERMRELTKDKRTEMIKREHLTVVRKSFKTLMRNLDTVPPEQVNDQIDDILGAYYQADGDPEMIRAMMRRWAVEANADKSLLLLINRLKQNAQDGGTAKLYLDYAK